MPIVLKEKIENQRYESDDCQTVLQRCKVNPKIWKLYENNVQTDYGIYREEVAANNDCVIIDSP